MQVWGNTDSGRVRVNNEDAWLAETSLRVAAVADGMGGEACGEVASALTLQALCDALRSAETDLRDAARRANVLVRQQAQQRSLCSGMGSTLVAASWKGEHVDIVNVGDSRAYLFREGRLTQLTYDQTVGNELRHAMGWSEEEFEKFPQRHVLTAAIGAASDVVVRSTQIDLEPGDLLLLCSDGLYNPIGDSGIVEVLNSSASVDGAIRSLIAAANAAGGPDNITVVVMQFSGT
ncbi:MAG: serine/threonine-protein phosphatase [Bryobacterales bacterium]|nr:serine/threonine-protein phosphatase [Bryobacterales bacterium]